MEMIGGYIERLLDVVVGEGLADGTFFSVSTFNRGIEYDMYRKYVTPTEHRIIAKANSLAQDNLLHICGWRGMRMICLFSLIMISVLLTGLFMQSTFLLQRAKRCSTTNV